MPLMPYVAPALTAHLIERLPRLCDPNGCSVDDLYWRLGGLGHDPCDILLGLLSTPNFRLLPKIGPVKAIRPRYGLTGQIAGVDVFTDSDTLPGDYLVIQLAPLHADDARSATRAVLADDPTLTKANAFEAAKQLCPSLTRRSFDMTWSIARADLSLEARPKGGRPRKRIALCCK